MTAERKKFFLLKKHRKERLNCFKNERGQALAELMVILIGICFVLLGVILFSVVGVNGIQNMIKARKEADRNMAEGISRLSGRQISYWSNIENGEGDSLQFTADDTAIGGSSASGGIFRDELVSTDAKLDMNTLAGSSTNGHFRVFDLAVNRLFFFAASLTSGSVRINDVMSDPKLKDARRALERFGLSSKVDIEDTVYMPDIYSDRN